MKLLNEYLDHALTFERMADEESNPVVKAQFEAQAVAYRKLAAERASFIHSRSRRCCPITSRVGKLDLSKLGLRNDHCETLFRLRRNQMGL
jgi:hypothetical protein